VEIKFLCVVCNEMTFANSTETIVKQEKKCRACYRSDIEARNSNIHVGKNINDLKRVKVHSKTCTKPLQVFLCFECNHVMKSNTGKPKHCTKCKSRQVIKNTNTLIN